MNASVTADAGYERLGNYLFLQSNGQMSFIKPANHDQRKHKKELRNTSLENISSNYGVYLRLCRSIQVEGAFGLLKTDFGFRRFLTRGKANVRAELFFLRLAFNLKKYWMKRENGRLQTHLSRLNTA